MKKIDLEALVNTLRAALDAAVRERQRAEVATQRAEMEKQAAFHQLRSLEQRLAAPAPVTEQRDTIRFINSEQIYRPAIDDERPDIWVSDARIAGAERVPFVKVR